MAFNEGQIRPPSFSAVVFIVIGLAVLVLISASVVIIPAGERGVVFSNINGVRQTVRGEGMTFILPFVERIIPYDIKTQTYNIGTSDSDSTTTGINEGAIEARTKDGQTVQVELSVRFQPQEDTLWKLHKEVGSNYVTKIIQPEIRSVVRGVVALYNVMDVYSERRMDIQKQIEQELTRTFGKYYIVLNEVLIRNTVFSKEFQNAIEAKQVALQEAQRMEYVLQKEEQEKQRKIIEAKGEAESIKIRGQALASNPRLIQYEYVQKLTPGIKGVITDQQTIMNFSNLFEAKSN